MVGFSKMIQSVEKTHEQKAKKQNMRELAVSKVPHNPKIEHALGTTTSPGQKWVTH
jgi:hypothetical protein